MLHKTDEYDIKEYDWWLGIILPIAALYVFIQVMGYYVWQAEHLASEANILTYNDAKWVVQIAASTIGFGDFYPVTELGRDLIATSFYTGMTLIGIMIGAITSKIHSFFDGSIQNRKLRKQNDNILVMLHTLKKDS